jgi:phosphoserine/homoserine phosphotransferase
LIALTPCFSHTFAEKMPCVKQSVVTLDMEGVLTPEIWIAVAEKTGIKDLRLTTRDIPDYDVLMKGRLKILDSHGLKLPDIQQVIGSLGPLEGALEFLRQLRAMTQVIILSDTFEEFATPLLRQLEFPTLFCHRLEVLDGHIVNYCLRITEMKRKSVAALRGLNYHVVAAGDSFNDIAMLKAANQGFLFRAPENIRRQFPEFPAVDSYAELLSLIREAL